MKKATILAILALLAGLMAVPAVAEAGPAVQVPIAGTTGIASSTPGTEHGTPGGVFHESGGIAELLYAGDVAGSVTCYYRPTTIRADGRLLVFSCSIEGDFTWSGRTGPVTGQINGRCTADVPGVFFCSGTQVAHGTGALDGVTFNISWWGPWSSEPFDYEGFALDTNR